MSCRSRRTRGGWVRTMAFVCVILVAAPAGLASTVEEYEFGEWGGSLDTSSETSPLEIWVDNRGEEEFNRLYLACTPKGWRSEMKDLRVFAAFYTLAPEIAEFER